MSPTSQIDSGSTAWMLTSSALVLLMVPGLALFYGGMVSRKNVISTMMQSFVALAVVGLQWVIIGYSMAFGKSHHGVFGYSPELFLLSSLSYTKLIDGKGIPEFVFVMFQGKFAIITPALISGATIGRLRFRSYLIFMVLWTTFVYCPLAHWVWSSEGWLFKYGVLDFAGGTVVHIAAGVSALVLLWLVGPRVDRGVVAPNNLMLTLTGAGLLWFGWFGFNAGSAVAVESPVAGTAAGLAFTTTQIAAATAGLVWLLLEYWVKRSASSLGFASGIVAGLVAITPAAGHVMPSGAIVIGSLAAVFCYIAVHAKAYDDTLDAFGIHAVGGLLGSLLTGVLCVTPVLASWDQFWKQLVGSFVAVCYTAAGTFVLAKIVDKLSGLRVPKEDEVRGLDIVVHGEQGVNW